MSPAERHHVGVYPGGQAGRLPTPKCWGENSDCCLCICTKRQFRVCSILGDPGANRDEKKKKGTYCTFSLLKRALSSAYPQGNFRYVCYTNGTLYSLKTDKLDTKRAPKRAPMRAVFCQTGGHLSMPFCLLRGHFSARFCHPRGQFIMF